MYIGMFNYTNQFPNYIIMDGTVVVVIATKRDSPAALFRILFFFLNGIKV